MVKSFTAFTYEIDEPEIAVQEIIEQIKPEENLLKNSVGIIGCYSEFIDTGVVKAICDALPFDIMGVTTMGCSMNGAKGMLMLSLMVITSDDVQLSAGLSESVADFDEKKIQNLFDGCMEKLNCEPKLILANVPLLFTVSGDVFLESLNRVSNEIPVFGTVACDHTADYKETNVIFNGEAYKDRLAIIVVAGDISPKFEIASVPEERMMKQSAIITDSDANILKTVNGLSVLEYLNELGLCKDGKILGSATIPFMIDYNDGTKPVTRAMFGQTPEGYAVCGGYMPVNSTFLIGSLDYNDVVNSTERCIKNLVDEEESGCFLMYSCIGRNFALGLKNQDEMAKIEDLLGGKAAFLLTYSGGEICPLYDSNGELQNRFHNDTLIICRF